MSKMTVKMMNCNRKNATRLVLVNWSRFSNVLINLEGSTLFTGINGSGKSTILDAITYMLTGNTQFNKAAQDKDRNVVSYVRGDTKSEGKDRFLREGEVTSYIAMEFFSPFDRKYFVVGVGIEYVNETRNSRKWFVFNDTQIKDCKFYEENGNIVTVFPRRQLLVKGAKVPATEFMDLKKGTERIIRALGLRCEVEEYRSKLVKMMSFNPENNINRFIQECVLDKHEVDAMEKIREQRAKYDEIKRNYEELDRGKKQLEVINQKIEAYEKEERKYQVRRILLLYQDMQLAKENRIRLEAEIKSDEAELGYMEAQLQELNVKKDKALKRRVEAEKNKILINMDNLLRGLEDSIATLKEKISKNEKELKKLTNLCENIKTLLATVDTSDYLTEEERAVMEQISSELFASDKKIKSFIKLKTNVASEKERLNRKKYAVEDEIGRITKETEAIQDKICKLNANILPFDQKYEDAKKYIENELLKIGIRTEVRLFAELVNDIDESWQAAIETFLGKKRFDIIVDGRYCGAVMKIVHDKGLKDIKVVITDKLPHTEVTPQSAAEMLDIPNEEARRYANYLLNGIHLCKDIDELHDYPKGGLMLDGTLAKSYTMTCMNISKTQFYMGKDAIKKQLKKAEEDKESLSQQIVELENSFSVVKNQLSCIENVDWDETRYYFDAKKDIFTDKAELHKKEEEIEKLKNTPELIALTQERDEAKREYEKIEDDYNGLNRKIGACKEKVEGNKEKYNSSEMDIKKKQLIYDDAILERLEIKKEMLELYEKLRAKSKNARVMEASTVERVCSDKDNAIRALGDEQRRYWHIIGQSDERYGVGFISIFRQEYRNIANVKIEEAKKSLEEQQRVLETAFMNDFVADINEAIKKAEKEIDSINAELKNMPFGKDTYQFTMDKKPERAGFFELCKKLEEYMYPLEHYNKANSNDEETEYNIRQFMDTVMQEENEEEYTDYRKYFNYDMKIRSNQDGEETSAALSKKQGSASNGEKQTPYFIILAASLLQYYPRNSVCARLAFIDEAFSALSRERIEQMVRFFEDNNFQVIYAAPPEKIDSIGSYINSTVSLCMKGKYTWAVEGLVKLYEFKQ